MNIYVPCRAGAPHPSKIKPCVKDRSHLPVNVGAHLSLERGGRGQGRVAEKKKKAISLIILRTCVSTRRERGISTQIRMLGNEFPLIPTVCHGTGIRNL